MKSLVGCVITLVLTLLVSSPIEAATIQSVDLEAATVSVGVGNIKVIVTPTPPPEDGRRFTLYGYTSPYARVVIQNPGIHSEEYADEKGYFVFEYLFLALFREDICIVAHDTNKVSTPPMCIPPPDGETTTRTIGPVLLPPSAQISNGNAYVGDTVTFVGQTIPNVDVKLSMFTDEMQAGKKLSLIPSAYAYTLPQLDLRSNKKGEYSLTLPTASSQFMRMFTRSIYEGNSTPKSTTLILDIFPIWMLLFRFFANIFNLIKDRLLEILLLIQLYGLLMYFLKKYFSAHALQMHRKRAIIVRHNALTISNHDVVFNPQTKLMVRNTMQLLLSK